MVAEAELATEAEETGTEVEETVAAMEEMMVGVGKYSRRIQTREHRLGCLSPHSDWYS